MEAFQLRLWDGRIGRWLSPDPYGQEYSPYMGMGNNPIINIDPDGGWKTRFGAWWHGLWDGRDGTIFKSEKLGDYGIRYADDINNGSGNDLNEVVVSHTFGGQRYDNNNGGTPWVYKDPYPQYKLDWFENRLSGSRVWGTGGGTSEFGNKLGSSGVLYKPYYMDEWVIPSGGGTNLTSLSHKTNIIPNLVRATKIVSGGVENANNLANNIPIKYTINVHVKRYHILCHSKKIDSLPESIKFTGDYKTLRWKRDSTLQNHKDQRRTALIWNFNE